MQMNVPNSGPSGLPGKLTNTSFDDAADLQSLSRALWVVDGQRVIINYETQLRRRKGKKECILGYLDVDGPSVWPIVTKPRHHYPLDLGWGWPIGSTIVTKQGKLRRVTDIWCRQCNGLSESPRHSQ